jgi:hypothetical protein
LVVKSSMRALKFDLDLALRKLGRWLVAQGEPLPLGLPSSQIKDDGSPISPEERSFLFWLAVGHLERHAFVELRPSDPPPCPERESLCRRAGAAQAILLGCDAGRDRKEIPHVAQLREAFKQAHLHLKKLVDAIEDYLDNCDILHRDRWDKMPAVIHEPGSKVKIHNHHAVCELPDALASEVADVARFMLLVDGVSLRPQYASQPLARGFNLRHRPRPLLLAEMQAALADNGWKDHREIGEIIDDGQKGRPDQIEDRIRKRIKSRLPRNKNARNAKKADSPATPLSKTGASA